jgi:hypothetical protein
VEGQYPQFESLSLRQLALRHLFSGRAYGQLSPTEAVISHLGLALPIGSAGLLFSKRLVFLRSSGLYPLDTVLEIGTLGETCKLQRNEVLPLLSHRRERLVSRLSSRLCCIILSP